ncbi:MAG: hypothetical protein Q4G30_03140 [Actinomycetaceae bacterium]|nr:hypothetical protein [Actinomycetaceae bacterium]
MADPEFPKRRRSIHRPEVQSRSPKVQEQDSNEITGVPIGDTSTVLNAWLSNHAGRHDDVPVQTTEQWVQVEVGDTGAVPRVSKDPEKRKRDRGRLRQGTPDLQEPKASTPADAVENPRDIPEKRHRSRRRALPPTSTPMVDTSTIPVVRLETQGDNRAPAIPDVAVAESKPKGNQKKSRGADNVIGRYWWALAILALILLIALGLMWFLKANTTKEDEVRITVTGQVGATPVVTLEGGALPIQATKVKTRIQGAGPEIDPQKPTLLKVTVFSGKDGRRISPAQDPGIFVVKDGKDILSATAIPTVMTDAIQGATEGSRLVLRQPVSGKDGTLMEINVIDILPTSAQGDVVELPADLPVNMQATEPPIIKPQGDAPFETRVLPIVRGTGSQIRQGQTLLIQYRSIAWNAPDIMVHDTWVEGPETVDLSRTWDGISKGLIDVKVGSRVLLLLPASAADGVHAYVMFADILAAWETPTGASTTTSEDE